MKKFWIIGTILSLSLYNSPSFAFWQGGGGEGVPGGTNTQIQFNDNGVFGGSDKFFIDASNNVSISADASPVVATGGVVTTVDEFTIHTFNSSGTFSVTSGGSIEYLLIAGGAGGAGSSPAGGGGAGSVETGIFIISAGDFPVVIGTGGLGETTTIATNGENSTFNNITAFGGGRGGSDKGVPLSGGSGGGGNSAPQNGAAAGNGSNVHAGGNGTSAPYSGGGGGGSDETGGSRVGSVAGKGGDGIISNISGTPTAYAAGGAGGGYIGSSITGGLGGIGGGGRGGRFTPGATDDGEDATPNSGSGGGGGASGGLGNHYGGDGGSGLLILRYTSALSLTAKLSVNQTGVEKIVDFQDSGSSVFTIADGGNVAINGNVALSTVGNKISIKSGTNASIGKATLVAGTVTVPNTIVTANSLIFLSRIDNDGVAKSLSYSIIPGTSFTIYSTLASDVSSVSWWIIEATP